MTKRNKGLIRRVRVSSKYALRKQGRNLEKRINLWPPIAKMGVVLTTFTCESASSIWAPIGWGAFCSGNFKKAAIYLGGAAITKTGAIMGYYSIGKYAYGKAKELYQEHAPEAIKRYVIKYKDKYKKMFPKEKKYPRVIEITHPSPSTSVANTEIPIDQITDYNPQEEKNIGKKLN